MFRRVLEVFLVCSASALAWSPAADLARAHTAIEAVPLRFEANQGQWRPEVRFAARSGAGTLFFTAHGPALSAGGRRVDITLERGNSTPVLDALDPLPGTTDYFLGNASKWHSHVAQYARVAYRSVYPGVDVVYYGSHNQLEYDFLLRPGADPKTIRMRFAGADSVRVTAEGDLEVEIGDAHFLQKRPVIYQQDPRSGQRRSVEGRYTVLGRNLAGLRLDAYNRSQTLVIDPVLLYSSFLGGSSKDGIVSVKSDGTGRIYVAGYTMNSDLPATDDSLQLSNNGALDCFIAILDPNQGYGKSLVYFTYLGGGRDDVPTDMIVDSSGTVYVTGTTTSSDFPLRGSSAQTSLSLGTTSAAFLPDVFVAQLTRRDGIIYSTYYGGTGSDVPNGIALDSQKNIYVVGTTDSDAFPVTANAYAAVRYGPTDVFILKLDAATGGADYATYIGGDTRDDGRGIAVAPNGLVYFAASTLSTLFPLAGPSYSNSLTGLENLAIGVIDPSKSGSDSLIYATYFGGTYVDEVRKVTLDAQGRLLLTGWTLSPDFPVTANAMQPFNNGSGDIFVMRVNPGATADKFLDYATYVGGSGGDVAYDITTDAAGAIYVAGYTMSPDFPVTNDAEQITWGNGINAFVLKFDTSVPGPGALLYGSYFGGAGNHVANGVAIGPNGEIYVGGYTTGRFELSDFPYSGKFAGGYTDGFVLALH
jgi:hypothetical protein